MDGERCNAQAKESTKPNKCEDWTVGSNTLEELQYYLKTRYALKLGKERAFDLENHMNNIRHNLLTKMIVPHQVDFEEDVIRNCITYNDVFSRRKKWEYMKVVEERTKQRSNDFLGYFFEEKDPIKRIQLIIGRFEELYRKKEAYLKEHHSGATAEHTLGENFEPPMEQLPPKR